MLQDEQEYEEMVFKVFPEGRVERQIIAPFCSEQSRNQDKRDTAYPYSGEDEEEQKSSRHSRQSSASSLLVVSAHNSQHKRQASVVIAR